MTETTTPTPLIIGIFGAHGTEDTGDQWGGASDQWGGAGERGDGKWWP